MDLLGTMVRHQDGDGRISLDHQGPLDVLVLPDAPGMVDFVVDESMEDGK